MLPRGGQPPVPLSQQGHLPEGHTHSLCLDWMVTHLCHDGDPHTHTPDPVSQELACALQPDDPKPHNPLELVLSLQHKVCALQGLLSTQ